VSDAISQMSQTEYLFLLAAILSVVLLLVLWIIIRMEWKMRMIEKKLDAIGENASEMVKIGLRYFGGKK
jgi:hypothetical protein